jgi:hypothetical protein
MRGTANQVVNIAPQFLLPLGDNQYLNSSTQGAEPSLANYQASYGASWGQIAGKVPGLVVRPVPGNHEYGDVSDTNTGPFTGDTYYKYFGASGLNQLPPSVTGPANDWYSYDIPVSGGSWHVIALDSECGAIPAGGAANGCASGSPQETWLRQDLAAHANTCTLAYWHEPRWAAGADGNNPLYSAFWSDVVQYRTTMVLNGHSHYYQRYTPMDASGSASATGVAEFQVGTGGVDHAAISQSPPSTVQSQDSSHFGVLKLTLHASSATYAFQATSGATIDSGTQNCNLGTTPPPSGSRPAVTSVTPPSGPSAGGTVVTVTGNGFVAGATVSFGGTPATNVQVASATSLRATAPAGTTTVDVSVTTPGGTSAAGVADEFTRTYATNGYGATLTASGTAPAVGTAVTLTATANKDVGPTPYGLSIVDVTTGAVVVHVGSGTTATTSVSQPAPGAHRYVAQIDSHGGPPVQAVSSPVVVSW